MGDLTGKVAIVTGAGRGLGREEAMQLARQGARVVINDINRPGAAEAAHATALDIKGFGGEAMAVLGDCADSSDAENLLKSTRHPFIIVRDGVLLRREEKASRSLLAAVADRIKQSRISNEEKGRILGNMIALFDDASVQFVGASTAWA